MSKLVSVFHRFNLSGTPLRIANAAPVLPNSKPGMGTKNIAAINDEGFGSNDNTSNEEIPEADVIVQPGELSFEEDTAGA